MTAAQPGPTLAHRFGEVSVILGDYVLRCDGRTASFTVSTGPEAR